MEEKELTLQEGQAAYEFSFLLPSGQGDEELEAYLSGEGITIASKSALQQIVLSYPIKKQTSANFGFYRLVVTDKEVLKKIDAELKLKDFIIRHLLVKIPKQALVSRARPVAPAPAPEKKADTPPAVPQLDNLSNEKLEQTLEEILK